MENPIGLGGITLVIAAVVWLAIFVPGLSKRSELKANSNLVRSDVRKAQQKTPMTSDQQLHRLINTQRFFSVLFAMFLLGSIGCMVAAANQGVWWTAAVGLFVLAMLSIFVSRAASNQASKIAGHLHRNRQNVRKLASQVRPVVENREWAPNPIPAPLNQPRVGELVNNLAEVVEIQRPQPVFESKDLDAILARRRAI